MLERSARRASLVVMSLASTLVLTACGGDDSKPKTTGASKASEPKAPPVEDKPTKADTKAAPEEADPAKEPAGDEGKPDVGGGPAAADGGEAADAQGGQGGPDGAEAGDDPAAEGGAEPAAEGEGGDEPAAEGGSEPAAESGSEPAAEGGAEAGGKDSAALIKEARTTKTTDDRAVAALAEAETAGATVKELARAAKARGDYLYKSPDRAKVFYEWSAAKDENYAEPVFALAKQKAVTGDVEDVVKLLKQVSERKGGKKLLEQIDFDPTWDIVKDDPDVRALL